MKNTGSILDASILGSRLTVRDALVSTGLAVATGLTTYVLLKGIESAMSTDVNLLDSSTPSIL